MQKQTHYQLLNIDKDASADVVKLAYERLLIDAKKKLEDSPLYFEKEKKLNQAYQVLSNTQRRQLYDKKLLQEQHIQKQRIHAQSINHNTTEPFNLLTFLGDFIFSKIFWGSAVLISILYFFIPGPQDNNKLTGQQTAITKYYENQNKQFEKAQQMQQVYSEKRQNYQQSLIKQRQERKKIAEKRRLELEVQRIEQEEKRALAKQKRQERNQKLKKEREEKRALAKLERKKQQEKAAREQRERQQIYEAKRRAQKLISKQKYEEYRRQQKKKVATANIPE